LLTGVSFVIMSALDVKLGFGFSAGLFDYVLNFGKATRPLLLIPVGLAYAGVYYGAFRWAIVRFDLKTPGREAEAVTAPPALADGAARRRPPQRSPPLRLSSRRSTRRPGSPRSAAAPTSRVAGCVRRGST